MAANYPGCSSFVRQIYTRKGITGDTIDVLLASLSPSTWKQYNCTFSKWWSFCSGNREHIFSPDTSQVLAFLEKEFKRGANYNTLNTHRSALNFICDVGKCELVERFMKGVFKIKPTFPRYDEIWDPLPVLTFAENLSPLQKLTLTKLTLKLVILLAMSSAQRAQTLAKIKISNISTQENGLVIHITDIIKTSAPQRCQPKLVFPAFKEKPNLCTATTLQHYINVTRELRGNYDQLILTHKKPYHPATPQTISRWIKNALKLSGIDTKKFKSHSTRHAASTAALQSGIHIDNIKSAAGWSEKSETFAKFYNRPRGEYFANYIKEIAQ
ncbi:unnamed protein product [Callosobruchus maculatus]|uniref:Tyr recombinase domain-containing protein n=1 Tax=Callosobruchus maculatus TaxID=64391 RepID=A0A653CKK6_CALMS|nr:unnamed protein product [Callosobruchus maculatus]